MENDAAFSVIVPVYNGIETLDQCLSAWTGQRYPAASFEIIVVNDGSTDGTAEAAKRFPVRVVTLPIRQGRVAARHSGMEAARYDRLVFSDIRVIPPPDYLEKIHQRNYQPLIPGVKVYDGRRWGFSRFFHLLRWRYYAPYYPTEGKFGEFFITPDNFNRAPKGTTNLVCSRMLWRECQPETADRFTNDDTLIFDKMVRQRPLLVTDVAEVLYLQRQAFCHVILHLYERGPRFADFYLRPGGRFFPFYRILWGLMGLSLIGVALPSYALLGSMILIAGLGMFGISIFLSRRCLDLVVVMTCLPVVAGAFGAGILRWQGMRWLKGFQALLKKGGRSQ